MDARIGSEFDFISFPKLECAPGKCLAKECTSKRRHAHRQDPASNYPQPFLSCHKRNSSLNRTMLQKPK